MEVDSEEDDYVKWRTICNRLGRWVTIESL